MTGTVDSAFVSGQLHLPTNGRWVDSAMASRMTEDLADALNSTGTLYTTVTGILAGLCILAAILCLRQIANAMPAVLGCLVRWKESLNLENSMKLVIDRNATTAVLAVPFCMMCARYRLYSPEFARDTEGLAFLILTAGVLIGFFLLRFAAMKFIRPAKGSRKTYEAAFLTSYSFFCVAAALTLPTAGICSLIGVCDELTRTVLLYETAAVYLIFILRKAQIFMNICSYLQAFLYLCALEILPAAILVVSAVIL